MTPRRSVSRIEPFLSFPIAGAACLALALLAAGGTASADKRPAGGHRGPSRSAVLFIGDGMGPAYVTATRLARGGVSGHLHLDDMPFTALVRTWAVDSPVTDSAAAATAMACGRKTVNGVLCEDATAVYARQDGKKLEPLAIWAAKRGIRVGIVTTARVTHATPAAFYAPQKNRDAERDIARQALSSPIDLLLGGGRRFFRPAPPATEEDGWSPSDREDLEGAARAGGWSIVDSAEAMRRAAKAPGKILGLFSESHMPYETPGLERAAPTLAEMTRFAIDRLASSGGPFFLMVEGGRIDHAGHANWVRTLVDETTAFDEAIGVALGRLDPRTTLVLATADHETGGLAINGYPDWQDGVLGVGGAGGQGSATYPVLTFASGPGVRPPSPGPEGDETPPHGAEDPRPSAISLSSAAHTGIDVTLYAWGAGAERAHGTLENTAVHRLLQAQLQGTEPDRLSLTRPPR